MMVNRSAIEIIFKSFVPLKSDWPDFLAEFLALSSGNSKEARII